MLSTYEWSHERWLSRHQLGSRWESLGEHVEYSVRLAILTDPDPRVSRIAFRARDQSLRRLDLVFESTGGGIRHQDRISIDRVDDRPVVYSLLQTPDCVPVIPPGRRSFYFSVESYQIIDCRAELAHGQAVEVPDSREFHLSQTWFDTSSWKRRWGRTWNCDAIAEAKRGIGEYWRFGFGRPRTVVYSPAALTGRRARRPVWPTLALGIGRVMGGSWLATCQFWLAIWSRLFVLDDDEHLRWRWKVVSESTPAG
ncbi:hypothetical protein ACVCIC_00475 [Burkholderia glumae]